MLIEFSVGNFRSFKETVTFSMVAANLKSQDETIDDNNTFAANNKLRLLKSAAIYGANASGKTNLAKAMQFMKRFALNSSKNTQEGEPIPTDVFRLSETTRNEPSFFQIVFLAECVQYRYGFEVTANRIVSEWLFSAAAARESNLFQRDAEGIRVNPKTFREGKNLKDKTRDNALFLSTVTQFNGETAKRILTWFRAFNIISGSDDDHHMGYSLKRLDGESGRNDAVRLVISLDLDIKNIEITKEEITTNFERLEDSNLPLNQRTQKSPAPAAPMKLEVLGGKSIHTCFDAQGDPSSDVIAEISEFESEGTQKLIALSGPLTDTLEFGRVLFVDELDARLHPLITCAIIRLFNSKETNPHNAQLVFATHDTNLLNKDLFRRDQIWFAEKDRNRATHLYSLAEFRVRNDRSSLESDYIHGKFGAIPFLGDLERVFGGRKAARGEEK